MKEKTASLWSNLANNPFRNLLLIYLFFIPVQLNKYFWFDFSNLSGLRSDYLSPTFFATDFLFIPLFIFSLKKIVDRFSTKQKIFTVVILSYFICFSFFAPTPLLSLYGLLRVVQLFILVFLIYYFSKEIVLVTLLKYTLFLSAVLTVFLAGFQFYLQHSIGGPFYFLGERTFTSQTPGIANVSVYGSLYLRPYATFPHPNVFAGYLLTVFSFALFATSLQTIIKKKLYSVCLLLLLIGIALSFSRTAIIIAFLLTILKFYSYKKIAVVFGGIGLIILFVTLPGQHLLDSSLGEESITTRITGFYFATQLFLDSPIFGHGLKQYLPTLVQFFPTLPYSALQPVHSIWMLLLVETGVVGIGILCTVIYYLKKQNLFTLKNKLLTPTLLIILGIGLMDHYFWTLHQGQLIFALLLGYLFYKPRENLDEIGMPSNRNYPKQKSMKTRQSKITQVNQENSSKRSLKRVKK